MTGAVVVQSLPGANVSGVNVVVISLGLLDSVVDRIPQRSAIGEAMSSAEGRFAIGRAAYISRMTRMSVARRMHVGV